VDSPNTSMTDGNVFLGVTCISGYDCWTVGFYQPSGLPFQTMTAHWNGVSWEIITSPSTNAADDNDLQAVSCTSPSDCWAVGFRQAINPGVGPAQTLIERWDGMSWVIVDSPDSSPIQDNLLNDLICTSSSACWAVGRGTNTQTLIERWDGTSWSVVDSPNVEATQTNYLLGVACASFTDCWAVGTYFSGSADQTLTEHYIAPPIQLNGVVSRKTHGSAGTFDLDLTSGNGIECRSGGANNDYTLVFTFANTLASVDGASVTSGIGSVNSGGIDSNDAHNYIINLTGVANAQRITVSLSNVADSAGNFSSIVIAQMGVLVGDVNASSRVDAADVSSVRQQTLETVATSNFRNDINASGRIDAADVSIVRQHTLTSLP
jgi:hypothetical protein